MDYCTDIDWEEAWDYQPGFVVEVKSEPGVLHTIESYDPMMVPPVWLADDPRPRYPHELRIVSHATAYACQLAVAAAAPQRQMCSL